MGAGAIHDGEFRRDNCHPIELLRHLEIRGISEQAARLEASREESRAFAGGPAPGPDQAPARAHAEAAFRPLLRHLQVASELLH